MIYKILNSNIILNRSIFHPRRCSIIWIT